ncbi:hypothetical protein FIV42_19950 [Persicimonas caeni]|uniref:PKD domain-containing protein n=1 Tax=Persicimonas caeni TaxID=2292766 RepID=A0A4Y6PX80_PERCE|nr:PKD domain-containing protein [Persicimonas caeni]QDG52932.1 hypothetical protein FIV42_19950 [Persicimonas caeni]QED34154.1 hypothetical protein FRD00_19945 [Persicimonas caeni]
MQDAQRVLSRLVPVGALVAALAVGAVACDDDDDTNNTPAPADTGQDAAADVGVDTSVDATPDTTADTAPDTTAENQAPTAVIAAPTEIEATGTITFDGSGSTDPDGDALSYTWEVTSAPDLSLATLDDASAEMPTLLADAAGEVVIELTVSDGELEDTATATVTVTCPAPVEVSGDIDTDTTWPANGYGCTHYLVTGTVRVLEGLTIEPGVNVSFEQGTGMRHSRGATSPFVAEGTATHPILFTGTTESPGHWKGLLISSDLADNSLVDVIIEYGGSEAWWSDVRAGNLSVMDLTTGGTVASASIEHTTLRHSADAGLVTAEQGASFPVFNANVVTQNAVPVSINANQLQWLGAPGDNDFTGNTDDYIEIHDATTGNRVVDGQNWVDMGVPYHFTDNVHVLSAADLVVEPGVELLFAENTALYVGGTIEAVGTASEPVRFASILDQDGAWNGIRIESNSVVNVLEHVVVEDGGQSRIGAGVDEPANLTLFKNNGRDASITLRDSVFRDSAGVDITFQNESFTDYQLRDCSNVTFETPPVSCPFPAP